MNIGQLMRGLLGEVQAGDGKALELKVGQIVRGVFIQMLDNQDALIQINGTQVRARLEAQVLPGQTTLLQVQPQSTGAMLVLKPVDQQGATLPEESLKDWIKSSGLPDQKWTYELVRDMHRNGAAMTRETAALFQQAAAAMPAGGDAKVWMQAAALAFKRGLPMTGAAIGALQQVLSGAPAHALLEALEQGLAAWRGGGSAGSAADEAAPPVAAQAAAAKLQALLGEGAALMRAAQGGAQPAAAGTQGAALGGAAGAERPASGGAGAAAAPEAGAAGDAAAPSAARSAAMAAPAAGGPAAPHAGQAAPSAGRQAGAGAQGAAAAPQTAGTPQMAGAPQAAGTTQSAAAPSQSAGHTGLDEAAKHNGGWVGQLIKWLGVDHERLLAASLLNSSQQAVSETKQAGEGTKLQQPENKSAPAHQTQPEYSDRPERAAITLNTSNEKALQLASPGTPLAEDGPVQPDAAKPAMDSLKSALMTLASSDDVPQALRDTAQQLVQQITGQQLLLAPERTNTPLTHVTMFIPLQGPDGGQTASVHIQTRRGRKGELDGNNCRLLFDLRMKTLGDTVVDVNVVDKIVSLNLWNDHPAISELLEASRGEMNEVLQNAGFQLLSLRSTPMPDRKAESPGGSETKADVPSPAYPDWSPKRYKGVDFRV